MKKLVLTIAVAALFMFGCQDGNSIVQPTLKQNAGTTQQLQTAPEKLSKFDFGGVIIDTTKTGDIVLPDSRYGWVH